MTDSERRSAWSAWLRARMEARGLSVRDLMAACGAGKGTVQGWMNGSDPAGSKVRALAAALGVPLDVLLDAMEGKAARLRRVGRAA